MTRPSRKQIDAAAEMLAEVGAMRGLSNLRHGDLPGELIADVEEDRDYFDIVGFMDDVEGRVGFRPDVIPSEAPGADPRGPIGDRVTDAA